MLRFIVALVLLSPIAAMAGAPTKLVPVFQGLLPKDFVVKDAVQPAQAGDFEGKTLGIVVSTNLENITKWWVDFYERGGAERQAQNFALAAGALSGAGLSASASGIQQGSSIAEQGRGLVRDASDPRGFMERAVAAIGPFFAKVVVAKDVADAFDQGADYVAVLDLWWTFYPAAINTKCRSNGSVQVLDDALERVLLAEGKSDFKRNSVWSFNPGSILKGTADSMSRLIQEPGDQIEQILRQKLGPPPPPEPVVPVLNTSPIQQCIEACKANTARTAEQCFDSCNVPSR